MKTVGRVSQGECGWEPCGVLVRVGGCYYCDLESTISEATWRMMLTYPDSHLVCMRCSRSELNRERVIATYGNRNNKRYRVYRNGDNTEVEWLLSDLESCGCCSTRVVTASDESFVHYDMHICELCWDTWFNSMTLAGREIIQVSDRQWWSCPLAIAKGVQTATVEAYMEE